MELHWNTPSTAKGEQQWGIMAIEWGGVKKDEKSSEISIGWIF